MAITMGNLLAVLALLVFAPLAENPRHRADNPVPVDTAEGISPEASLTRPTQWNPDPEGFIRGASVPGAATTETPSTKPKGEPGQVEPCKQKNPFALLKAIPELLHPQAAPQGGVYFLGRLNDVGQVYYLKDPQSLPEPRTRFKYGVTHYELSPDGSAILTQRSVDGSRQWGLDLTSVAHPTGKHLAGGGDKGRVDSAKWIDNNSWAFTLTEDGETWRALAQTKAGESRLLGKFDQPIQVVDATADHLLLARLLSQGQQELQVWDLKKNKALPPHIIATVASARFSKDGKGIFLLSDRGKGPVRLYHYDRVAGSELRLVSPRTAYVDRFFLNPSHSALYYSEVSRGYHTLKGIQIDDRGRTRKGMPAPPKGPWVLEGVGPSEQGVFVVRSNARHSPDLWQWKGGRFAQWTQSQRPLQFPKCIPMPEYVEYPGQDALPIPAFLYRPEGELPDRFVMVLPDQAGNGFQPRFHREILYLVERGIGVLAPNLRGSPFGTRHYKDLDNGPGRSKTVGDVLSGAQWLTEKRLAKPGSVGLFGTHYGGTLALLALQIKPDFFMGAFVGRPVMKAPEFVSRAPAAERPGLTYEFGLLENAPWASQLNPDLKKIPKPILALEGGDVPKGPNRELLPAPKRPYEGAPVVTQRLLWAQRGGFGIFAPQKGKGP